MTEPQPSQEGHKFSTEEINEINSGIVTHLAKALKQYPNIRELLGKGRLDTFDPTRTLETLNWAYTFARLEPDYLKLIIFKRPISEQAADSGIVEERIDIVCGEDALNQHDVTKKGKPKFPPDRNNSTAVKKTTAFISELEAQI